MRTLPWVAAVFALLARTRKHHPITRATRSRSAAAYAGAAGFGEERYS